MMGDFTIQLQLEYCFLELKYMNVQWLIPQEMCPGKLNTNRNNLRNASYLIWRVTWSLMWSRTLDLNGAIFRQHLSNPCGCTRAESCTLRTHFLFKAVRRSKKRKQLAWHSLVRLIQETGGGQTAVQSSRCFNMSSLCSDGRVSWRLYFLLAINAASPLYVRP